MKKILLSVLSLGLMISLNSCRDETLNPLPGWEPGLHGFTVFDGVAAGKDPAARPQPFEAYYAKNFPTANQDKSTGVPFKIRWVSLDNKLTASKIEIFIDMLEYYNDPDGNPKTADLGGDGVGKLVTTISAPAANRQWNNFTITPTQVYTLFKDATVKYDKVKSVPVFSNPDNPRPTGKWFNGSEDFLISWKIYTSDGKVYKAWSTNICGDPTPYSEAAANCNLAFDVQ